MNIIASPTPFLLFKHATLKATVPLADYGLTPSHHLHLKHYKVPKRSTLSYVLCAVSLNQTSSANASSW